VRFGEDGASHGSKALPNKAATQKGAGKIKQSVVDLREPNIPGRGRPGGACLKSVGRSGQRTYDKGLRRAGFVKDERARNRRMEPGVIDSHRAQSKGT